MQSSSLRAPTKFERRRLDQIPLVGCVVCSHFIQIRQQAEVHHLTLGGRHGAKRRGHAYTIGLCPWHHRGQVLNPAIDTPAILGVSYALLPRLFRETYGDDQALLVLQSELMIRAERMYVMPKPFADPVSPGGIWRP